VSCCSKEKARKEEGNSKTLNSFSCERRTTTTVQPDIIKVEQKTGEPNYVPQEVVVQSKRSGRVRVIAAKRVDYGK